jgi:YVTN family beta-propeller protein
LKRNLLLSLGVAGLVTVLATAQTATPPENGDLTNWKTAQVGQQQGRSLAAVLPTDQAIHPAGQTTAFEGRPSAIALRPDGRTGAILKTTRTFGQGKGPLLILELASGKVLQEFSPFDASEASFNGIAYSPDGSKLFASEANGFLMMASVAADGRLFRGRKIKLPVTNPKWGEFRYRPEGSNSGYPGGIAVTPDGRFLYVTLSINNTVAVVDVEKEQVVGEIPVGNAPYTVVRDGNFAYVTNQGGREANRGEYTTGSADTALVADPETGRPTTGTVSVIDLGSRKVVSTIPVGLQPTGMLLHEKTLFVANSNSDTVSVVDTSLRKVIKTISVQPFPSAPFGSSPNALVMLADGRLVVSLGANNALAVYNWEGPSESVTLQGLIPTAWYPSALALDRKRILVTALKGSAPPPMESVPDTKGFGRSVLHFVGSVSFVDVPSKKALALDTHTVITDNRWQSRFAANRAARPGMPARAIPDRIGEPSLLKHIFYVIKENHKYDQDLGDDERGNGAPGNVEFGRATTPNQHAMVRQFPLLDNFYVSGTVSIDGHQWADSAFVNDYIERSFGGGFKRGYPFNGGDSLAYAPTGFLWELALRSHKSVEVFGEYAAHFDGPAEKPVPWADWYHDAQVMNGKVKEPLRVNLGDFQAKSDVPSLDKLLDRNFPGFDTDIPDQYRFEIFLRQFQRHVEHQDLPDLTIMTLCDDHTGGIVPGIPTPRAQVADNDLAFGRLVDVISHSPYWKDSVIIAVEDDAAYGVDHVDGHRSPVYVVSPYARHGVVDHTYYTQIDVVRTLEQILGLLPMNQKDLVAVPMTTAFTNVPDYTPFQSVPNEFALDEMNPAQSASRIRQAWTQESIKQFAAQPQKPDVGDENKTKRAIWYASFDFKRPFPGDSRVLFPIEIPASKKKDHDDD